ncbi:hypothetical protein KAU13_00740, partial [candidate division WOR-3 bacterium]|nr:hypothetical protein [candidate division WOR-3 bacterium]
GLIFTFKNVEIPHFYVLVISPSFPQDTNIFTKLVISPSFPQDTNIFTKLVISPSFPQDTNKSFTLS